MHKSALHKYAEVTNNSNFSKMLQERQKKFMESREREKLIEEITQRVLSQISAKVDVNDAIKQIRTLREEINKGV